MALRKTILANGQIYHIFNRSVRSLTIFKGKKDYSLFLEAMQYYLQSEPPTRFSLYRIQKNKYSINLQNKIVTVINYCLMPTHFHLTLRQEREDGIKQFIQRLTNSFAHYFNIKYKSKGPVFEGNFKAARVETDEQLLHLSRYIHLNPVTNYLVEKPEDYSYSSYLVYLGKEKSNIIETSFILNKISKGSYQKFVLDQVDYQRKLDLVKYLIIG